MQCSFETSCNSIGYPTLYRQAILTYNDVNIATCPYSMFLKWFSRNNQYGNFLVTGLLKHIRGNAQAKETELLEIDITFEILR
jgi:hypothetical protein